MQINLIAYGIAKDILGSKRLTLEVPESSNILQIKNQLTSLYPKFSLLRHYNIAVNESYEKDEYTVCQGDELVIIPPVSGG